MNREKTVAVRFKINSKVYNSKYRLYRTFFPVSAGEEVVVDAGEGDLRVALVVNADYEFPYPHKLDYLIQKVDKSDYKKVTNTQRKIDEVAAVLETLSEEEFDGILDALLQLKRCR